MGTKILVQNIPFQATVMEVMDLFKYFHLRTVLFFIKLWGKVCMPQTEFCAHSGHIGQSNL